MDGGRGDDVGDGGRGVVVVVVWLVVVVVVLVGVWLVVVVVWLVVVGVFAFDGVEAGARDVRRRSHLRLRDMRWRCLLLILFRKRDAAVVGRLLLKCRVGRC